jgi:DNA transformation protein and related proteins
MAKPPDRYLEFVQEQLSPLGEISNRFMFGGYCLYCDGVPFALVADGELYLKGDDVNIPRFQARGLRAFKPFPDREDTMKYFQAPPEIFENSDAMKEWCGGAVDCGRRASSKKKKPTAKPPAAAARKKKV